MALGTALPGTHMTSAAALSYSVSPQSTVLITFANKLNSSHRCSMRLLGPQASCPKTGAVITAACFRAAASASGVHVYCYKLRPLACMQELLPSHIPVQRVSFKEITEPAIEQAMSAPRAVNEELAQAHIARIASDHLLRSSVSPMLWKKLLGYKSPGHASSVALRLICDRETERDMHNTATFYTATAHLSKPPGCAQVCASPLNASTTATTSRGNEQIACWVLQTWCLSPHITSPSNASTPADHCHSPRRWTSRACPKPRQGSWQHLVQAAGCWVCRSGERAHRLLLAATPTPLHHLPPAAGRVALAGLHLPADHASGAVTL